MVTGAGLIFALPTSQQKKEKKKNCILVTGHEGPQGCHVEPTTFSRQFTGGSEVISIICQLTFTLRKIPGIHFC
jgi:hypothetical protein